MLRVSEVYPSVQGEGPNVGLPTQFIRFAGCNLRCPGWPCDTPHAIEPSIWKVESKKYSAKDLLDQLPLYPYNLCLTGGEPFIQPNLELAEFCNLALMFGYTIECFTNGTKPFPNWALARIRFMMDWKLVGSGETFNEETEATRHQNALSLTRNDGIKFVVKDETDLREALGTWAELTTDGVQAQFWATPVWDAYEPRDIVEFIQENELPWKLSLQSHKYIWPADARGV